MGIRYAYAINSITQTATGNTTLANSTYLGGFAGGAATQRINYSEIYLGGEATGASAVIVETFGRDSTAVTSPGAAGGTLTLMDGGGTAAGTLPIVGNSFTTAPVLGATHLLNLSFNAYGGIVRWVARPGEEISTVGATAASGSVTLSAFTNSGSAPVSAHVLLEVC